MQRIYWSIFAILLSFNCLSQTYWRLENENKEEILLTMKVDVKNMTFEAYTREDALKELAGTFTYMLAKTAGKLKYPEIVHSNGKISIIKDTTFYSGSFYYLDKTYTFTAKTWQSSFVGTIVDNRNRQHPLFGDKVPSNMPLKDYGAIIDQAFSLTEKYYFDRKLQSSSEWKTFKNDVNKVKANIADDYELVATFYWYGKKLPMGSYEIRKNFIREGNPNRMKNAAIRELNSKTILLDLGNLAEDAKGMAELFTQIQKANYSNLILDARGRRNIPLHSALILCDHLTSQRTLWGSYVTKLATDANDQLPLYSELEKSLKNFRSFSDNNDILNGNGVYLKTEPAIPGFKGIVYILIDHRTSKVAEAFAIWLKKEKMATIVGEESSGSPMLAHTFDLDKQYQITIQVAQFLDRDGKSYVDVKTVPDIVVNEGDALNFLLKKIN